MLDSLTSEMGRSDGQNIIHDQLQLDDKQVANDINGLTTMSLWGHFFAGHPFTDLMLSSHIEDGIDTLNGKKKKC